MPELPEVEIVKQSLSKKITFKKITKWPVIEKRVFGDSRHPPDLFPDVKHAKEVNRALVVCHNDTRPLKPQQLCLALEPPLDAENSGQRIHHPCPEPGVLH